MKKKTPSVVLLFIMLFVVFSESALAASTLTMGTAIDKAGRQRMLTQRMMKAYALAGQKLKLNAVSEMQAAMDLFSSQLAELKEFAQGKQEKDQIAKISFIWDELRPDLETEKTPDKAAELNDLADVLLQESHIFVGMLEKRSGTVAGKVVNVSGRQRMLSQRIAKTYLLEGWGLSSADMKKQFEKASNEFAEALDYLERSEKNTKQIKQSLAAVRNNWRVFGISNYSAKYNTRVPSLVVRSMDKILKQMNDITALYAALK